MVKKYADGGSVSPWSEDYAVGGSLGPKPAAPTAAPAAAATPAPTPAKVETATETLARKFPIGGTPYEAPKGTHSVATANVDIKDPGSTSSLASPSDSAWNVMADKAPKGKNEYADGGMVGMNTQNADAMMQGNMMDRHNPDNRLPKHAHHNGRGHG